MHKSKRSYSRSSSRERYHSRQRRRISSPEEGEVFGEDDAVTSITRNESSTSTSPTKKTKSLMERLDPPPSNLTHPLPPTPPVATVSKGFRSKVPFPFNNRSDAPGHPNNLGGNHTLSRSDSHKSVRTRDVYLPPPHQSQTSQHQASSSKYSYNRDSPAKGDHYSPGARPRSRSPPSPRYNDSRRDQDIFKAPYPPSSLPAKPEEPTSWTRKRERSSSSASHPANQEKELKLVPRRDTKEPLPGEPTQSSSWQMEAMDEKKRGHDDPRRMRHRDDVYTRQDGWVRAKERGRESPPPSGHHSSQRSGTDRSDAKNSDLADLPRIFPDDSRRMRHRDDVYTRQGDWVRTKESDRETPPPSGHSQRSGTDHSDPKQSSQEDLVRIFPDDSRRMRHRGDIYTRRGSLVRAKESDRESPPPSGHHASQWSGTDSYRPTDDRRNSWHDNDSPSSYDRRHRSPKPTSRRSPAIPLSPRGPEPEATPSPPPPPPPPIPSRPRFESIRMPRPHSPKPIVQGRPSNFSPISTNRRSPGVIYVKSAHDRPRIPTQDNGPSTSWPDNRTKIEQAAFTYRHPMDRPPLRNMAPPGSSDTGPSTSKHPPQSQPQSQPQPPQPPSALQRTFSPPPPRISLLQEQGIYKRNFKGVGFIANYDVSGKLGEGTFGEVHSAVYTPTGAKVALKRIFMHNEKEGMPITALREIKILKALSHPNIVSLREVLVVKSSGVPPKIYMVFPYMEHDLAGLLENERVQFTPSQIKLYMKQLLEGTEYLHRNHILHRDMKAANLLIDNKGVLQIADFGLARSYDPKNCRGISDEAHRRAVEDNLLFNLPPPKRKRPDKYTNCVVTRWYRPPELLMGARNYGGEIDLWGIGCILGEMFTRRPIMQGESDMDQLTRIWQLCGTANNTTWPGWEDLPGCEGIKKFQIFPRVLRNKFGERLPDDHTVDLLDKLLTLDPLKRPTATSALDHDYFWTDPLPADPKTLPTYESSHEYDRAKIKAARDSANAKMRGNTRLRAAAPPHAHQLPPPLHRAGGGGPGQGDNRSGFRDWRAGPGGDRGMGVGGGGFDNRYRPNPHHHHQQNQPNHPQYPHFQPGPGHGHGPPPINEDIFRAPPDPYSGGPSRPEDPHFGQPPPNGPDYSRNNYIAPEHYNGRLPYGHDRRPAPNPVPVPRNPDSYGSSHPPYPRGFFPPTGPDMNRGGGGQRPSGAGLPPKPNTFHDRNSKHSRQGEPADVKLSYG